MLHFFNSYLFFIAPVVMLQHQHQPFNLSLCHDSLVGIPYQERGHVESRLG